MTTLAGPGPPIVAIGASAGGIEPLVTILGTLPADLPASVLVVVHGPPTAGSLPRVLSRAGPLPASHPEDGQPIEASQVYVAVPNRHLIVQDGVMRLSRGPHVNRARPAVDPLFQSAALARGSDVIGVVLSGSLDDGTAGLAAIKRRGGVTVVQDPDEAAFPGMPRSAMTLMGPDHVLPASEIGRLIVKLLASREAGDEWRMAGSNGDIHGDNGFGSANLVGVQEGIDPDGIPSEFGCPECGGTLWEIDQHGVLIFHCRVGHSYTPRHLMDAERDAVENGLWQAFRALEEQAVLAGRLRERAHGQGRKAAAMRFAQQEQTARTQAATIRSALARTLAAAEDQEEQAAEAYETEMAEAGAAEA
jgi:two-component system chemotaxis response regulator CheB